MNSPIVNSKPSLTIKKQAVPRDMELVVAAQAGSPTAFGELERRYSQQLFRTAFSITRNREDAEDALQDTLLRAYLALDSFEGRSSLYSWLTRIAINSALMTLRKRRARPEISVEPSEAVDDGLPFEVKDPGLNPEQLYDQRQRRITMLRAIDKLEPKLRETIQIHVTQGCSMKEIARTLDVTVATVKARLHRARRRLDTSWGFRTLGRGTKYRSADSSVAGGFLPFQNREQPCTNCD
jgi:RNA polymerase sigma-70 factor, ECF subfamily